MSDLVQWQRAEWPCPEPLCEAGRSMVLYEISSSGPWAVRSPVVDCPVCGTAYDVKLRVGPDGKAHVSLSRVET